MPETQPAPSPRRQGEAPADVVRTVHRAVVSVGVPTTLPCSEYDIVHVDARQLDVIDVWYIAVPGEPVEAQPSLTFIALGTGQHVPPRSSHLGTALSPAVSGMLRGHFVWHLWTYSTAVPA